VVVLVSTQTIAQRQVKMVALVAVVVVQTVITKLVVLE
jgi:hypothetical protein